MGQVSQRIHEIVESCETYDEAVNRSEEAGLGGDSDMLLAMWQSIKAEGDALIVFDREDLSSFVVVIGAKSDEEAWRAAGITDSYPPEAGDRWDLIKANIIDLT